MSHAIDQLQQTVEARAAELIQEHQQEMSRAYDQMIHEYKAGYHDHRLWVQGRREADARWLAAIAEQQEGLTEGNASWQHLEAVVRRVQGGAA